MQAAVQGRWRTGGAAAVGKRAAQARRRGMVAGDARLERNRRQGVRRLLRSDRQASGGRLRRQVRRHREGLAVLVQRHGREAVHPRGHRARGAAPRAAAAVAVRACRWQACRRAQPVARVRRRTQGAVHVRRVGCDSSAQCQRAVGGGGVGRAVVARR